MEGVQKSYDVMREVWDEQGADDRLVTRIWDEKHFFNRGMQAEVAAFFDRYLK